VRGDRERRAKIEISRPVRRRKRVCRGLWFEEKAVAYDDID